MIDERLDALSESARARSSPVATGSQRTSATPAIARRPTGSRRCAGQRRGVADQRRRALVTPSCSAFAEASHRLGEVPGRALEGREDAWPSGGRRGGASAGEQRGRRRRSRPWHRGRREGQPEGPRIRRRDAAGGGGRCRAARPRRCAAGWSGRSPRRPRAFRPADPAAPRGRWSAKRARRPWLDARSIAFDRSATTPPAREERLRRALSGPPRRCARRRRGVTEARRESAALRRRLKARRGKATG